MDRVEKGNPNGRAGAMGKKRRIAGKKSDMVTAGTRITYSYSQKV